MRASIPTKLSLYDWTTIIGMNPLHVAGIDLSSIRGAHCTKPLPQYEWQEGDRVGREAIARAIAMAEENMENYLGFNLAPAWTVNESVLAPTAYPPEIGFYLISRNYTARRGYFIEGGRRAVTLLDANAAITWLDGSLGNDIPPGYYWTVGEVTVAVDDDLDPCEVHIFYPGHDADPAWEIRPITVEIAGGVATIQFRRELAVDPDQWDALVYEAANGDDDADFLEDVDVYRVYNDPSQQLSFYGHPHLCACGGATQPIITAGQALATDPTLSQVNVAKGTWTNGVFTANYAACTPVATRALFSYRSGYRNEAAACPLNVMDGQMARAVAVYAAALLERPPCDCTVDSWEYWRENANEGARYAVQSTPTNPFGTRRGMVYAWERVLELSLGQGAVLH